MKETFQVIEQMKESGVIADYAIAGAVGAIFYVEPFQTGDIDFLVNLPIKDNLLVSLEPIYAWLRYRGYTEFDDGGHIHIEGWAVQFLPVTDPLSTEALAQAQYLPFDETLSVRVLRPEYLAAEALKVSRLKDVQRVSLLLEAEDFDFSRFSDLIERFGLEKQWRKIQTFLEPYSGRPL